VPTGGASRPSATVSAPRRRRRATRSPSEEASTGGARRPDEVGPDQLYARKLRSFDEPAFRWLTARCAVADHGATGVKGMRGMATRMRREQAKLYDTDFVRWTEEQAATLRARRFDGLDLENLAEEIESLGKRDRRRLKSRLTVLLMHLLKWGFQPEQRSGSWDSTIRTQRADIRQLLDDSPTLRREIPAVIAERYDMARRNAAAETGLPMATFPTDCPFAVDEILAEEWLPG
jgi:Domain of unknown function DUF29